MKTMKTRKYRWSPNKAANFALLKSLKKGSRVGVKMSNGGEHKGRVILAEADDKNGIARIHLRDVLNHRPFSVASDQNDVDVIATRADDGSRFKATGEDAAGKEEGNDEAIFRDEAFAGDTGGNSLPDSPLGDRLEKRRKRAETQLSFALSEYEKLDPTGKDYTPLRRSALSEDGFDPDTDEATVTRCLELLKERGIHLEDDTDASNFCARLCTALHALQPGNEQDEAMGGDEDDPSTHFTQRGRSNPDEDVSGMEYLLSLNRLDRLREETPALIQIARRQGREQRRERQAERHAKAIQRLTRS